MMQTTPPPGGTGRERQAADGHQEGREPGHTVHPSYDYGDKDGYGDTDRYGGASGAAPEGGPGEPAWGAPPPRPSDHAVAASPHAVAASPHATDGPGIRAEHVSRAFGNVQAVLDLSFEAPRGAVTALVGPNGCGKSTLMLMLASLLAPDSGRVLIGGIDPTKDSPAVRRAVGWMPDQFGAWDSLRVAEVLEVMGRAYFLPSRQVSTRAMELLDLMDLQTLAQQPAHVLSRGQKQRLGLARAMVHSPQVLILDEPASGLDPASRRRLLRVVRQTASDGTTVLVSSHILSELEEMADHVVFMDAGRVVDASSIRALAARPRPWKVGSLDHDALVRALEAVGVQHSGVAPPDSTASGHAEATFQLPDEATAARLLADLTAQGARIVSFGPATGRLEAAYLSSAAAQRQGAL